MPKSNQLEDERDVPNPQQKPCPVCHATGYIVRNQFPSEVMDCDFCSAHGYVFIDYDATDAQERRPKPMYSE